MSATYSSAAEQAIAAHFISLGCIPCQSFHPHFQTEFPDKNGYMFTALPDFYHKPSNTFFEYKCGALNSKGSFLAADNKLRGQYRFRFKQDSSALSHYAVSERLWKARYQYDCLEHAWNHSLAKHLIVQRALSPQHYVVVFDIDLPGEAISKKYERKGLFSIPLENLQRYLY
jgi:hypothetical protein